MKKVVLTVLIGLGLSMSSHAQLGQLGGFAKKASGMVNKVANPGSTVASAASAASAPDQPNPGPTSPVHARNSGKIVFASAVEALALQKENEAAFGSTFALGKPIYFRAYMANSLSNLAQRLLPGTSREVIDTHASFKINFYLDGALAYSNVLRGGFPEEIKQNTTFKGALQAEGTEYIGLEFFRAFIADNEAKLTPGSHKLKMEVLPALEYPEQKTGAVMAAGEITLNVGASTANANDTRTCLPAAGMKDAALEAKILQAFKAKNWPEKPAVVRITGSRWNIIRNELTSVIIKRSVAAVVASTKNGKCGYQDFLFSQDYDGAGYQPEVYLDGVGSPNDIPCGCLK